MLIDDSPKGYTKVVDKSLSITLEYTKRSAAETECLLTFINTGDGNLVINPSQSNNGTLEGDQRSWLSSVWGSNNEESGYSQMPQIKPDGETHLFLGYIQLFGYVVLNYKFGLDDGTNISLSDKFPRNSSWWTNKEYTQTYLDPDEDIYERNETLGSVPFIQDNSIHQLSIGGKLGGINDLAIEDDATANLQIDLRLRYYLQDLVYNFNSYKAPNPKDNINDDGKVALKQLTDAILPFYSTSQSLLFSDLTLNANSRKTFRFVFPNIPDAPPSYNANSTGVALDQGLISIRYLLVLGFLKIDPNNRLQPVTIYYPYNVVYPKVDERWSQPDFLQSVTIDKAWKISMVDETKQKDVAQEDELENKFIEDKKSFLGDLDKLIEADIHNLPKLATTERRKSINSLHEPAEQNLGLLPQLPQHLKNQYKILVNNCELCLVTISKPYYHIGEDISYHIELHNDHPTKVVGVIVHVEAREEFHLQGGKKFSNVYKVTLDSKTNAFAPAVQSVYGPHDTKNLFISGYTNVPVHLSQQFQSSKLMDLKYYIIFKFNLLKFDEVPAELQGQETPIHEEPEDLVNEDNNHEGESVPLVVDITEKAGDFSYIDDHRFGNHGKEFTFRFPVTILP